MDFLKTKVDLLVVVIDLGRHFFSRKLLMVPLVLLVTPLELVEFLAIGAGEETAIATTTMSGIKVF